MRDIRYQSMIEKDKKYIWHPFTHIKEWMDEDIIIVEKGKGPYLIDIEGKRYIDGVSSLWCNVWGHQFKPLDREFITQIRKISHSTMLGLSNVKAIELAEALVNIAPKSLHKVFYSNSGSEAVEVALKISYQYWRNKGFRKKKSFICFTNGYHGDTIGGVSVGGIDLFHSLYKDLLFRTFKVPAPYCYRCPFKSYGATKDADRGDTSNSERCCMESLSRLEDILRKHSDEICGIIIEPKIYAAGGFIIQPKGFLKNIEKLARKYDVHLLIDEVATGFGRTGRMFACEHEDVNPDIMMVAKSLSGGYLPLSATLVSKSIFDAFVGDYSEHKTFFHGHTYGGNALACAVSLKNIQLMKKYRLVQYVQKMGRIFKSELSKFYRLQNVGDIRQVGLMCGIEVVKNRDTKEEFPYEDRVGYKITLIARKHGLFIRPLGNVIVLMPPLYIKEKVLKKIVEITYKSINEFFGS